MGKIDIDYQKLHDAFFKFQTKPKMTEFGELYVLLFPERTVNESTNGMMTMMKME